MIHKKTAERIRGEYLKLFTCRPIQKICQAPDFKPDLRKITKSGK
jgi:hypothetical protein